jgi:hypothetical protein
MARPIRRTTFGFLGIVLLAAGPLYADEAPNWNSEAPPEAVIKLAEPAQDEVVVVVNDNALGGNHAGLFAGATLIDPAGSYVWTRSRDKTWPGPTLADYARYQTVDGLKIRFYRFHLQQQTFAAIMRRIRDAGVTPPLFCASAVQNLLAGLAPFDRIKRVGFTTPTALGHVLDALTHGQGAIGVCQKLDASPC